MLLDRFRLDGKVAIVTGSGRGIGRGVAVAFAEAGADVTLVARTASEVEAVADSIRALGRRAIAIAADVTDQAELGRIAGRTLEELGRVDVLVNNAGGWPPTSVMKQTQTGFEDAFRFNVLSGFALSQKVIPHMQARGSGAIVNISSALSHLVERAFVAYGTCKAALNHMTRMMAHELAPAVRVNALAVGAVATSALEGFVSDPTLREQMVALTPMGRLGTVEDVAAAALYLASPAGEWVTGKVFEVDGGAPASTWPLDFTKLGV
jgi:7-alpha-hydroxysteroid dehydrogenase